MFNRVVAIVFVIVVILNFTVVNKLRNEEYPFIFDFLTSLNIYEKIVNGKNNANEESTISFSIISGHIFGIKLINLNLDKIPRSINKFKNLHELDLTDNKLTEIPYMEIPKLEYLILDSNKFQRFPKITAKNSLFGFGLYMAKNDFDNDVDLSLIPEDCYSLDLRYNSITSFSCHKLNTELHSLDIQGNGFVYFDSSIKEKLPNLHSIYITESEIKIDFRNIKNLKEIFLFADSSVNIDTNLIRPFTKVY